MVAARRHPVRAIPHTRVVIDNLNFRMTLIYGRVATKRHTSRDRHTLAKITR